MPNYERFGSWLSRRDQSTLLGSTDCVANLTGVDSSVTTPVFIGDFRIGLSGAGGATAETVDSKPENPGIWKIRSNDGIALVGLGSGAHALANVQDHAVRSWAIASIIDTASPDLTYRIGFYGTVGGVLRRYTLEFVSATNVWIATSDNGVDAPQSTQTLPGEIPGGIDEFLRFEIVVAKSQTEFRINGNEIAVHNLESEFVPLFLMWAQSSNGAIFAEMDIDAINVAQDGVVRQSSAS